MSTETIIKLVGVGVVVLVNVALVIINVVLNIKKRVKNGEKVTVKEIATEALTALSGLLQDDLVEYIEEAEKIDTSGAVKKTVVMSKAVIRCAELGLDYCSNSALISDTIDKLVAMTNKVNTNKGSNEIITIK